MANFGKKPKKPGSVPGAASGGKEKKAAARVRGVVGRAVRVQAAGRPARVNRAVRSAR
jgi:hypothetical protein